MGWFDWLLGSPEVAPRPEFLPEHRATEVRLPGRPAAGPYVEQRASGLVVVDWSSVPLGLFEDQTVFARTRGELEGIEGAFVLLAVPVGALASCSMATSELYDLLFAGHLARPAAIAVVGDPSEADPAGVYLLRSLGLACHPCDATAAGSGTLPVLEVTLSSGETLVGTVGDPL